MTEGVKLTKHDWMFDGRVMFCRKCFKNTAAPGRDGSEMSGECPGLGPLNIRRAALNPESAK